MKMNDQSDDKQPLPAVAPEPKPLADLPPVKPLLALPQTKVGKISGAIAAVMGEIGIVAKQGTNQFHRYRYAQMQDILQQLTPLLAKHGLVIWQEEASRPAIEENVMTVQYEFTVTHSSGEQRGPMFHTGVCRARDSKGNYDDKVVNKCHTQARKYFLLGLFQIPTGDMDDNDPSDQRRPVKAAPKPAYDDAIPDFEDSAPDPTLSPEAGPPAPSAQDSAPPGQGGTGESVLKIAEIKARQGRDALMAYTENLTVEDRRIVAAKIDHLKALYPYPK
jgi:hypothetical protein